MHKRQAPRNLSKCLGGDRISDWAASSVTRRTNHHGACQSEWQQQWLMLRQRLMTVQTIHLTEQVSWKRRVEPEIRDCISASDSGKIVAHLYLTVSDYQPTSTVSTSWAYLFWSSIFYRKEQLVTLFFPVTAAAMKRRFHTTAMRSSGQH